MRGFGRVYVFVREELGLHFVSINIREMVEDVLSKIRANFLGLLVAAVVLGCLVQTVVASQSLSFSFRILL